MKLKSIAGLLVEKNKCPIHGLDKPSPEIGGCNCYEIKIEDATLDLQGEVEITLDRERLAKYFLDVKWELLHDIFLCRQGEEATCTYDSCLRLSDAIIANEKSLIVRKELK